MHEHQVKVRVMATRNVTVADVELDGLARGKTISGSAKREPGERHDTKVGEWLAIGRAMKAAGEFLEAKALQRLEQIERGDAVPNEAASVLVDWLLRLFRGTGVNVSRLSGPSLATMSPILAPGGGVFLGSGYRPNTLRARLGDLPTVEVPDRVKARITSEEPSAHAEVVEDLAERVGPRMRSKIIGWNHGPLTLDPRVTNPQFGAVQVCKIDGQLWPCEAVQEVQAERKQRPSDGWSYRRMVAITCSPTAMLACRRCGRGVRPGETIQERLRDGKVIGLRHVGECPQVAAEASGR
jgi:hypothetical protein